MTRTTNARIAGFTFLFYFAGGISSLVLSGRATTGEGIAARLAGIAQHAMEMRVVALLSLLASFAAILDLGAMLAALALGLFCLTFGFEALASGGDRNGIPAVHRGGFIFSGASQTNSGAAPHPCSAPDSSAGAGRGHVVLAVARAQQTGLQGIVGVSAPEAA